jgi:hypothetical protein
MLKNGAEGGVRTHALMEKGREQVEHHGQMFLINIEYKLYICIYFLKKIKEIMLSRASTTGRGYSPSAARLSWLLQALGRF